MSQLSEYLTLACTGTGQATFYNTKKEQDKSLEDAHIAMMANNRRFYALTVAFPINDKSKQLIVQNLLASGKLVEDSALEGAAIGMVASDMQFNRLLNMMCDLREKKVNNSRTRKLAALVWEQIDAYRAIKYAPKIRAILAHAHIPEGSDPAKAEIHKWLFKKIKKASDITHNPKLASRLLAKSKYEEVFNLPYDIARDIAVNIHKKKVEDFDREFNGVAGTTDKEAVAAKGTATRKETMRARKVTGDTAIDFNKFGLYELLMHAHNNPNDVKAVMPFVDQKAKDMGRYLRLPGRAALVIDNSISAIGSAERRFQPLINMEATMHIFQNSEGTEVSTFFVGPEPDENGLLMAEGASNLRRPLINALMTRPDVVVIMSDGYENVRAGSVNQILSSKAVRDANISVLHLNPVSAVETGKPRVLSKLAVSLALPSPEQLPMVALLGVVDKHPEMLEPMLVEVEKCLKAGDYKKAKLALRTAAPVLTVGTRELEAVGG